MVLPEDLEQRFDDAVNQYEEEQKMQYITSFDLKLNSRELRAFRG